MLLCTPDKIIIDDSENSTSISSELISEQHWDILR